MSEKFYFESSKIIVSWQVRQLYVSYTNATYVTARETQNAPRWSISLKAGYDPS